MTPSEYRAMARCLSIGWRRPDGTPHADMVRAGKLGSAEAVIAQAARDLESGWSPAEVSVYLRRTLAEIVMEAGEYVEWKEAKAVEYEAKARELESARRIHVWVYARVETSRDAYETQCVDDYATTIGEFLDATDEDVTLEDLAALEVGDVLREGSIKVKRLPDVEEKAA